MTKALIVRVKTGRKKGQFRFKLIATNGEQIASSGTETYHNKADVYHTLNKYFANFTIMDETK